MEEIKKRLKRAAREGKLEDFLLSVLEENPKSDVLIKIFALLEEENSLPLSSPLFFLITDYLKEQKDYLSALAVCKRQAAFSPSDFKLRREAIALLKTIYPKEEIDTYIAQSHLDGDRDIKEGIETVENFMRFSVESFIFSPRTGLGQIKEYDFLLEKVFVAFPGASERIPIADLFKNFVPLSPDHFLVQKATNPASLKKMAEEDPFLLFQILLKSFGRLKISEIKSYLSEIVVNWEDYWTRVRPKVSSCSQIRVMQEKERIYEWIAKAPTKEKKAVEKKVKTIDSLPQEKTEIIEILGREELNYSQKRELLARVKGEREDWEDIFTSALFLTRDERTARFLWESISGENRETIIHKVFTDYRFHPFLLYFLGKNRKGDFSRKALFFRIYELMSNPQYKHFWRYSKTLLRQKEFFAEAVREMNEEERRRILASLPNIPSLLPYEKKEIENLLKGESGKEEEKEVIYNTESGIRKAEEELKNLIRVELARNAEALARARGYGDLRENYEYKIAKEERVRLLSRIKRLKGDLAKAVPINFPKGNPEKVVIGTKVKIKSKSGEIKEWTILGPWDIDIEKGAISYLSPFGQALLGKHLGEKILWEEEEYEIIGIESGKDS